eukprot:gene9670-biopygen12248
MTSDTNWGSDFYARGGGQDTVPWRKGYMYRVTARRAITLRVATPADAMWQQQRGGARLWGGALEWVSSKSMNLWGIK